MSSSSYFSILQLFWVGLQVAFAVLSLWIAALVFRHRTAATWMIVIGSIFWSLFAVGANLIPFAANWFDWNSSSGASGSPRWIEIYQMAHGGSSLGLLTFLIGLLLHLKRKSLEADRIADLEAILDDRQRDAAPPDATGPVHEGTGKHR